MRASNVAYLLDTVFLEWHEGDCCNSCADEPLEWADQGECCCYALKRPYPDAPRPFRYLISESAPGVHDREHIAEPEAGRESNL